MFLSKNGVLYDEDNYGTKYLGEIRTVVTTWAGSWDGVTYRADGTTPLITGLQPYYRSRVGTMSCAGTTNCTLFLRKKIKTNWNCNVTVDPALSVFVLRTVPTTRKLSSYTITESYATHTELAVDNLISQFKGKPNIEKLISCSMDELDEAQTDVYDFQDKIWNLEVAEEANLNICGKILGRDRVTGQSDRTYRNQLLTQVLINNGDGTLPNILSALLVLYNLEPSEDSRTYLQLQTLTHNNIEVYVKTSNMVNINGGVSQIQEMVPAGSSAIIVVNDINTVPGSYFVLGSVEGNADMGRGLGSYYDDTIGGEMVGIYNYEYYESPGVATGADLLTTTKTIPVETFG